MKSAYPSVRRRVRAHRAARVAHAASLPETFPRPDGFDLTQFWTRWTAEFEASLDRLRVTVRLPKAGLAALPAVLGDAEAAARATQDGNLHFDDPQAACRRLLGFGPEARELVADTARRTAVRY